MKSRIFIPIWLSIVFFVPVLLSSIFPLQKHYLGGGGDQYIQNPILFSHANFDGEHYVEIARSGYRPLQYFFFPFYPLSIRYVQPFFGQNTISFVMAGVFISICSFLISIYILKKLLRLDYGKGVVNLTIILLLVFPTSFYFQSVYTESLFLLLSVLSLYMARKKYWLVAAIAAALASGTRLIGIVLFPALLFEWFIEYTKTKSVRYIDLVSILIAPLGLVFYVLYLQIEVGDPLAFFHNVAIFGEQRSSSFVLLPQVFYRYLFKIIPSAISYWPMLFTTMLEFLVGCLMFVLSVCAFFKMRGSYAILLIGGFIIPTLSGSFSSLPRYALVLFPGFILMAEYLHTKPKYVQYVVVAISAVLMFISSMMFIRGYWVS